MAQGPWAFKLIFAGSYLAPMIMMMTLVRMMIPVVITKAMTAMMMVIMINTLSKVVASILFLIGLVAGGGASAW